MGQFHANSTQSARVILSDSAATGEVQLVCIISILGLPTRVEIPWKARVLLATNEIDDDSDDNDGGNDDDDDDSRND